MLKIPVALWVGFLTGISLFITVSFGIAVFKYQKNVFKYHKIFAFITVILGIIHMILMIMLWFFGISL